MASLAVFLNDALATFHAKGEVKPRYYNPGSLFSEVHFFTPARRDIDPALVQDVVGGAKLVIHPMGPGYAIAGLRTGSALGALLRAIRPAALRAYDPAARGALAVVWGRRLGIPAVVSVHADLDEQRRHERRPSHYLRRYLEQFTLARASRVACVSHHVARYVERHGARNPAVIYNRVDTRAFAPAAPRSLSSPPVVLSVARVEPQKAQDCLVRAAAGLGVRLVLVGDGSRAADLRRLVARLGLDGSVEMISAVSHREIPERYRAADIFAIATHYEGFCIPVLEAMATGLPIVASDVPSIREILGDAGLLVPTRPDAFREAISRLLSDAPLRAELAVRARRRARELDGTRMEAMEHELYHSLLVERAPVVADRVGGT